MPILAQLAVEARGPVLVRGRLRLSAVELPAVAAARAGQGRNLWGKQAQNEGWVTIKQAQTCN